MISSPLHNCIQVTLEIEYFKQKLTEFYKENKNLKQKLAQLNIENEKYRNKNSKDVDCQTDIINNNAKPNKSSNSCSKIPISMNSRMTPIVYPNKCSVCSNEKSKVKQDLKLYSTAQLEKRSIGVNTFDSDIYNKQNKKSYNKLCDMQHNLLKKYEDEVNANTVKQDLINHMQLELDQLVAKCKTFESEIADLKHKNQELDQVESKYKTLIIDYESSKLKCKKYKEELKCFDENFFDEIEDLKYNYAEAVKLNRHYEDLLFKLQQENLVVQKQTKKKNRVKFTLNQNDSDLKYLDSNEFALDDDDLDTSKYWKVYKSNRFDLSSSDEFG